jgi:DNA repair protein RecO (recombination protein O)
MKTPLYKTQAIVIDKKDLGETSRIITLFTERKGMIRGVAKGVRRLRSVFGSTLDVFSFIKCTIYEREGRDLDIITQAQMIDPFQEIREHLGRIEIGFFLVDLTRQVISGRSQEVESFRLLRDAFYWLNTEENKLIPIAFSLKLLSLQGILFRLIGDCTICGKDIGGEGGMLNFEQGGIVCLRCHRNGPLVSRRVLDIIEDILLLDIPRIRKMELSPDEMHELNRICFEWTIPYSVGRNLNSLKIIKCFNGQEVSRIR